MSSRDPHLGQRVSALADGALGHDDRDRALAHVAECARCLCDLEAERRLRARTAGMADPVMPTGLAERLLRIAQDDPWASGRPSRPPTTLRTVDRSSGRRRSGRSPRRGSPARQPVRSGGSSRPAPGASSRATSGAPAGSPSGSARPAGRSGGRAGAAGRRAATAFTGGVLTVAGVALGTAFAVGGTTTTVAGPSVVPPVTALTSEFAASSGSGPLSDTSAVGLAAGFSSAAFGLAGTVRPPGGPRVTSAATAGPSPSVAATETAAAGAVTPGTATTGAAGSGASSVESGAALRGSTVPASRASTAAAQWYGQSADRPAWTAAFVAVAGR